MVILINYSTKPFKVEYQNGNKTLVKQFPVNTIVAMKGLNVSEQITNRALLAKKGVTIWDYERNTFYYKNTAHTAPSRTAVSTLPFAFIGNNVKPTGVQSVAYSFSGTATISGMTFTESSAPSSIVYGIVTSANTAMANGTISARTIGYNTYVSFSGASTTTQNVYGALTGSSFSGFGITITGQGATKINTGATITSYLSASTRMTRGIWQTLQGLV